MVGAERGLATIAHQNVTGNGDAFSFTYGRSRGVNPIVDTSYSLPLNRYDTTFIASYRRNDFLVVALNFTPVPRKGFGIGVPEDTYYMEVFNSDSTYYGGSNVGNVMGAAARKPGAQGRPHHILVDLPPLGGVVFKPERK